ncbi:hypothetical protein HMI56_000086 [Coelomomyces lativittatus]|nr:hypothetical protein HMI56_000086 [Coelomomyces lativittatus]
MECKRIGGNHFETNPSNFSTSKNTSPYQKSKRDTVCTGPRGSSPSPLLFTRH